jgi:hypothetical protein
LYIAAILVTVGGVYDLFAPRLPANLSAMCGESESARRLARELLRALGGALAAIGISAAILVARMETLPDPSTLVLVLVLIGLAEVINASCMFRVGSPFYIPLTFVLLTILGVVLSWPRHVV